MLYYVILTVILTVSAGTYLYIKMVSNKYIDIKFKKDISGFETAKLILDSNKLDNTYIVERKNSITDEYDYHGKVIRLNTNSFHGEDIVSCIKSGFEASYAIEKDETIVKLNDIFNFIINLCSNIGIIATFIGIFICGNILYGGILLLTFVFIIEIISLLIEFKNSVNTFNNLELAKIMTKKEQNDVLSILNIYRFRNLSGIITSVINMIKSFIK